MKEYQNLILTLARDSYEAATLLRDASTAGCRACIAEISDINRHTLFELVELERQFLTTKDPTATVPLKVAHALRKCVTQAFSAAMLVWDDIPYLPPLVESVTANAQLAAYPVQLLEKGANAFLHTTSPHLCANKGRGAHALLLTNVCHTETGGRILPLALALESHRNALESACEVLMAME